MAETRRPASICAHSVTSVPMGCDGVFFCVFLLLTLLTSFYTVLVVKSRILPSHTNPFRAIVLRPLVLENPLQ